MTFTARRSSRSSQPRSRLAACLLIACMALGACGRTEPPAAQTPQVATHNPWTGSTGAEPALPVAFPTDGPVDDPQLREIVDGVRTQREAMFTNPPPPELLSRIESVFFETDNALELVDMYHAAVGDDPAHPLSARLAWLYAQVGQQSLAERSVQAAVRAAPDDAQRHVFNAMVLGRHEPVDDTLIWEIGEALERAFQLDPQVSSPGLITNAELNRQLTAVRDRLGVETLTTEPDTEQTPGEPESNGEPDPTVPAPTTPSREGSSQQSGTENE